MMITLVWDIKMKVAGLLSVSTAKLNSQGEMCVNETQDDAAVGLVAARFGRPG